MVEQSVADDPALPEGGSEGLKPEGAGGQETTTLSMPKIQRLPACRAQGQRYRFQIMALSDGDTNQGGTSKNSAASPV